MKFGIIGAMDIEVALLKEKMNIKNTMTKASMEFCEGTIGKTDVIVVKSGVAKVNAAICVQILCDIFGVTHIINTGIAGSLDNDINIGDIVISTDACYHDFDITALGYKKGEVPGIGSVEFPADKWLGDKAENACHVADKDISVFRGRICSGDQFISDDAVKDNIVSTFHGLCTEMEGAAIAQAAFLNKIPYVIIRAISDKADGNGTVDYPTFEKKAARDCASLVLYMLQHILE